jgi:hypothetical protein
MAGTGNLCAEDFDMTIDLTRRGLLAAGAASLISTPALKGTPAFAASGDALLDEVLQAHGGLETWKSVNWLDLKLTAKGPVFQFKGQSAGLRDVSMRIDPHATRVEVSPFPKAGSRGIFTPQRIWIEGEAGKVLEERTDFYQRLHSLPPATPWDTLDELAFVGEAVFEYLTLPYVLAEPDVKVEEIEPFTEYGTPWRRLRATFPARIPVHSAEQTFYFDDSFMLRRFDWAGPSTQYLFDPVTVGGLVFYKLRRVVPQKAPNPLFTSSTGVLIEMADISVSKS